MITSNNIKNVAMVPVRMGSKRVKNKNIRIINQKPLVYYILNSIIRSGFFNKSDIYLNSEDIIFEELANQIGIKFYHRSKHLASDSATNDDFVLDFLENIDCTNIFQFLSTSPLISSKTISKFVESHLTSNKPTTISVKEIRIECLFNDKPINFISTQKTPPSQLLTPIYAYACGLMAWKKTNFIKNYKSFKGAAYHGGENKTNLFCLNQIESIDIDNEEDFIIAQALLDNFSSKTNFASNKSNTPIYWNSSNKLSV